MELSVAGPQMFIQPGQTESESVCPQYLLNKRLLISKGLLQYMRD